MDPDWAPAMIGKATLIMAETAKHLRFCEGLLTVNRRVLMLRINSDRIYLRLASTTQEYSNHYAPMFATTNLFAPRMTLTLAPKLRIDMHTVAPIISPVSSNLRYKADRLKTGPSPIPPPAGNAQKLAHTTADGLIQSARLEASLTPVLQQVIEPQYRKEISIIKSSVSIFRRSQQRPVERIVLQPKNVAVVTPVTQPSSVTQSVSRQIKPWPSQQPAASAFAGIPDAEVTRLTDCVVQRINRRILSERERRGRI